MDTITDTTVVIPEGKPKSGRVWKTKQTERFSSIKREGILKHLSKSYEYKQANKQKLLLARALEAEMKEATKQKVMEKRARKEENLKRRAENEYKSASYQSINNEKLKGMSKKQLRNIKKTAVNKHGQVELVNLYGNGNSI